MLNLKTTDDRKSLQDIFNKTELTFDNHKELLDFACGGAKKAIDELTQRIFESAGIKIDPTQVKEFQELFANSVTDVIHTYYTNNFKWKKSEVLMALGINKNDVINCGYSFEGFKVQTNHSITEYDYDYVMISVENLRQNIEVHNKKNNLERELKVNDYRPAPKRMKI